MSGLLHILIGVIAIEVANGTGGEADQSGALSQLASTPGGIFILWTVVVGLTALGLWLIVSAFLFPPGETKKKAAHFVTDFAKGIIYLFLAATAFTFARGGTTNSAASTGNASRDILTSPGGVAMVAVIGCVIIGVGIYLLVKGISKRFTKDLTVPRGGAGKVTVGLGILGYVAKGIVLGTVGGLFLTASLTGDAAKADGLDGALKTLATLPYGPAILILVGVGLIAYGVYSFVRARFARL
ncbi:MAG: hypothetical protein JWR36_2248 [Glaciihabitans sp.]|nr:hypothetical protein [Glaciihabitans sp.]MDQ1569557.1 hypothetical protein [Actinomycetota bacterium]